MRAFTAPATFPAAEATEIINFVKMSLEIFPSTSHHFDYSAPPSGPEDTRAAEEDSLKRLRWSDSVETDSEERRPSTGGDSE